MATSYGPPRVRVAIAAAILVLVPAVAGCTGTSTASGTSATATSTVQQQARAVWLAYARCIRSHGYPDFPDPQVDGHGYPHFPDPGQDKSMAGRLQGSCGPILNRLPAAAQNPPVTAAELREETLFAACLRRHGLADWPDPRPDGTFPLANTPYPSEGKSGPVLAAMQACRQYDNFGSIRGSG
jgi:hypothetical protein